VRTLRRTREGETCFIVADAETLHAEALRGLYYMPMDGGYGKIYPADAPGLDAIYRNFETHAEEMVLQMAGLHPVPWEKTLLAFLDVVKHEKIDWFLCGSGALAVRGMKIVPHDLDLVVSDQDSARLASLLAACLIEPHVRVEDWFCNWFARAFVHARLEWVGGVDDRADTPEVSDFGPTARARLDTVVWHGNEVRVPPLDLQLAVNERRGLRDRVEMIERHLTS
jgi:hypothetical protein